MIEKIDNFSEKQNLIIFIIYIFQNILSLDDLKKNLNKVIRNVNYY